MSTKDIKSLDILVKTLASRVIKETLSPLQGKETEEDRQHVMAKELQSIRKAPRSKSSKDEDLEEAEDEEKKEEPSDDEGEAESAPEEKKSSEFVSKKIATGKEEPKKPKAVIPDPTEIKDVTFNQVVNMMNMMRSGKSAKDPDTKKKLDSYFKNLNPGEKQALFVLLSGLTQILAGGVEGDEAPDPGKVGIKIRPKPSDKDRPAKTPEKVMKTPGSPASVTKPAPAADENLPIIVGEAADRSNVLNRVRKLMVRS